MTTNRLAAEKSPYLLQHAHNPVEWYPWGEEALGRAREEDKPIFLSIGYSTCHWCHVMERESFENDAVAAVMNENFVCIKVDREERVDLDEIYMAAVQAMTGQGGWPLSAWLTPDLEPFYGGTYFPPDDRFGRPGFVRVLEALSEAWRDDREKVVAQAGELRRMLQRLGDIGGSGGDVKLELVDRALVELSGMYDAEHGGWGKAPKFPRADFGALHLRAFARTGDAARLAAAEHTMQCMMRGGLYDHLGGGFARYSTDDRWLVPHFEKMLYDNAQLAHHLIELYQVTAREDFAEAARGTLDYVLRDMTHEKGGFYSAEDADSEGEEGRFYVWSFAEIDRLLDAAQRDAFVAAYGVSPAGNWDGTNVLERVVEDEALAATLGIDVAEVRARLVAGREILFQHRESRVRPSLDDKILTAWNGLMIEAFARAAVVLDEERYLLAARNAADFVLGELDDGQGGLLRRWRDGESRFAAYAEDYAMLVRGLLELAQASGRPSDLENARRLHDALFEIFDDPTGGGLFNTRADQDDLLLRTKAGYDGSVPTANSVAAANALAIFELTGDDVHRAQAESILSAFAALLEQSPLALTNLLSTVDAWFAERVVVVVAAQDTKAAWAFVRACRSGYHPDLRVLVVTEETREALAVTAPVTRNRPRDDSPARAYVCRGMHCEQPVDSPEELRQQLDLIRRGEE